MKWNMKFVYYANHLKPITKWKKIDFEKEKRKEFCRQINAKLSRT